MGSLVEKISVYQRTVDKLRDHKREATAYMPPSQQRQWLTGHGLAWWASDHLEEIRHYSGWTFVGIHAIAKQFMSSKVTVSRLKKDTKLKTKSNIPDAAVDPKDDLPHHPIAMLLKRPNRVDSWGQFAYRLACQLRLTGGFLVWEVKNQLGYPFELWLIPRGWATPILPSVRFPEGGWRISPSSTSTGVLTSYLSQMGFERDAREFITGGYPHPLYPGEFMSPLSACAKQIDLAEKVDDSVWSIFDNMTVPGQVFSVDKDMELSPETLERFEAQLNATKGGVSNRGKNLVLQGVTKSAMDNPLTGLDHIDGRDQNRDHVLSIQHVPPISIGADSDGTYSGAAAKMMQFTELSVQPDLDIVAQCFQARWQPLYGDDIELSINAKRYDDPQMNITKTQTVLQAKSGGVKFSDNEIRGLLGFSNIPGGDVYEEAGGAPGGMPGGMPGMADAQGGAPEAQGEPAQDDASATSDEAMPDMMPDMSGAEADAVPDFDLTPELADDEETGQKNPLQNRIPSYLLNGSH